MESNQSLRAMFAIVNSGFAEDVIDIAREVGAKGATILHARGDGARHEVFMGITINAEKEIILCLVDEATAEKAMAAIKEKAGVSTPAHSICFSLPVDKLVGLHIAP